MAGRAADEQGVEKQPAELQMSRELRSSRHSMLMLGSQQPAQHADVE